MQYDVFQKFMNDVSTLKLSSAIGGDYVYDKDEIWGLMNRYQLYDVMSDLTNKFKKFSTMTDVVEQDYFLHSVEDRLGFNTYRYSRKMFDECMYQAERSFSAMDKKMILDYTDKKHHDEFIKSIAFGISIKMEQDWHTPDINWQYEPWYSKVALIQSDDYILGENIYFERETE